MSFKNDIRTFLISKSGITDIIGSAPARCYFDKLPQDPTFPALTIKRISNKKSYSQSGDSGLDTARVQITCWGETSEATQSLAEAVNTELSGYKGAAGSTTIGSAFQENELDDFEADSKRYMIPVDYMIQYNG